MCMKLITVSLSLWKQVLVDKIAGKSIEEREQEINQAADMANVYLKSGKDTLVLTSRQLVVGKSESSSMIVIHSFPSVNLYHLQCFLVSVISYFHSILQRNC